MSKPTIVVLNSLVARGSVGGRACVYAFERLGFPVVFVPTVILPWHPGHGRATRIAPPANDFRALVADLAAAPWLGTVGAVLTGYFSAVDQVAAVAALIAAVRQRNPAARYLCDPVAGDSGGLFIAAELADAIGETLLPMADMATPNRFELMHFTGAPAGTSDAPAAIRAATKGLAAPEVIVTSASLDEEAGRIATLVATPSGADLIGHALAAGAPKGTGDLFAALYLAHRLEGRAPCDAAVHAASSVLRMVEAAVANGDDELPLAASGGALIASPDGITVTPLA